MAPDSTFRLQNCSNALYLLEQSVVEQMAGPLEKAFDVEACLVLCAYLLMSTTLLAKIYDLRSSIVVLISS